MQQTSKEYIQQQWRSQGILDSISTYRYGVMLDPPVPYLYFFER